MDNAGSNLQTVTGQYVYVPNPCTTDPCLPGMAYAVLVNGKYCYIMVKGRWFSENRSWGEYTPQPNDMVTITGSLQEKRDVFGKPFSTIEAVSLKPAQ